jgi:hypothetical protein
MLCLAGCRLRETVSEILHTVFMKTTAFGMIPCRMPIQQDSRAGTAESALNQVIGSVGMQNKVKACTESRIVCLHSQDQGPFPQHAQHCHLVTMNGRFGAQPLPRVLGRLNDVIVEVFIGTRKQQTAQLAYLALPSSVQLQRVAYANLCVVL